MRTYCVVEQYKRLVCCIYGAGFILLVVLITIDIYSCCRRDHVVAPRHTCEEITRHQQYNSYKDLYNALKQYKVDAVCAFKHMDITHKDEYYQVDII